MLAAPVGAGSAAQQLAARPLCAVVGVHVPAETEVQVWDSTAEIRYLVVPQRPKGTEHMTEEQLAALVTRDSMIGTGNALPPST